MFWVEVRRTKDGWWVEDDLTIDYHYHMLLSLLSSSRLAEEEKCLRICVFVDYLAYEDIEWISTFGCARHSFMAEFFSFIFGVNARAFRYRNWKLTRMDNRR